MVLRLHETQSIRLSNFVPTRVCKHLITIPNTFGLGFMFLKLKAALITWIFVNRISVIRKTFKMFAIKLPTSFGVGRIPTTSNALRPIQNPRIYPHFKRKTRTPNVHPSSTGIHGAKNETSHVIKNLHPFISINIRF